MPEVSCSPSPAGLRVSLDLFTEAIRQVDDFFLTFVKLPG